ncbi:MAG: hypothetical protein JSW58_00155, partial [Candidatus Latescibacterota bacterium]
DLRLRSPSSQGLAVVWTSPGDDGRKGTAASYDIRYSNSAITEAVWDEATPVDPQTVPTPKPAGQIETVVVLGLDSATEYFFALKTSDEVPNISELSNCPSKHTLHESTPPAEVTDLLAIAVDDTSFVLTWTAPGDDWMSGTANRYDIRHSIEPILDGAAWAAATPVNEVPTPGPAGETQTFTVTGPRCRTSRFFALKTADELDNWSGLSNAAPGLAFRDQLWISPRTLQRGNEAYIVFRTKGTQTRTVTVHSNYGWVNCEEFILKELASEVFPEGVNILTYDFFDDQTGDYFPEDYYLVLVCLKLEEFAREAIHFVH